MRRAGTTWTLDWAGESSPEVGHVVRRVRSNGIVAGFWRLTSVRLVRNRKPLPEGYVARYRIGVEFVAKKRSDLRGDVNWTMYDHPAKPKPSITHDRFSPLLPEQQDQNMTETTRLTKESLAAALNGGRYPFELTKDQIKQAKAAGLIIIYGHSDDLMEFAGAIDDEIGVEDGGTAYLDRNGVLDRSQCESDEEIADYTIRKRKSRSIEALWCEEGDYSWTYRTEIPHSTFEIADEDGFPYCRGIVIDIADLPEPQREQAA